MILTRLLFSVTCLIVCYSKRKFRRDTFTALKCAGPKHLDAVGCAFRSPYGKVFQLNDKSISYENDTIHCLCKTQNYDPKKLCGILIENVQEKHVGKWICMLTYNINGRNVTAKGSTNLNEENLEQNHSEEYSEEDSVEDSKEGSGAEEEPTTQKPTTRTTTTQKPTTKYTTTRPPTSKYTTADSARERPMLELKTATEESANSDGLYQYKIISIDGSCTIEAEGDNMDNAGDDLALGAIDRYSGDQLGSCSDFKADDITSVVITHKGGDGWLGEYLKFYLNDKVFNCPLSKWVWVQDPKVEFQCFREERPMLELKTATEDSAASDGLYQYEFQSSDGSCTIEAE